MTAMKTFSRRSGDSAGVFVIARRTSLYPRRPILLSQRSRNVRAPLTWAPWGGRMERGESPAETAAREFREEAGFRGLLKLVGGSAWEHRVGAVGPFCLYRFYNFLGLVADQFDPPGVPNWEVEAARWLSLEEIEALPKPSLSLCSQPCDIHPGLQAYLAQDHVRTLLTGFCTRSE